MRALLVFHLRAGARIAIRSFAPLFSTILALIILNVDPAGAVIGFATAVFARRPAMAALAPVVLIAFLLPVWAAPKLVLKDINLNVGSGMTLVLGPNGSGKSTLLKIAAGIERPDRGKAEILGHDLWQDEIAARQKLAYVSEQPDLTPYATIRDVVYLVCRLRSEPLQRGREVLERVGLWGVANRSIRQLSSGQRRRAVLAAAWIGSPQVAVLDEPMESMDRAIREEILSWIDRLLRAGAAVVIATHEIEPLIDKAVRALVTVDGTSRQSEQLPADAAGRLTCLEAYSRGL
jgi:ABC-type multidrug transport system ATPase subunit